MASWLNFGGITVNQKELQDILRESVLEITPSMQQTLKSCLMNAVHESGVPFASEVKVDETRAKLVPQGLDLAISFDTHIGEVMRPAYGINDIEADLVMLFNDGYTASAMVPLPWVNTYSRTQRYNQMQDYRSKHGGLYGHYKSSANKPHGNAMSLTHRDGKFFIQQGISDFLSMYPQVFCDLQDKRYKKSAKISASKVRKYVSKNIQISKTYHGKRNMTANQALDYYSKHKSRLKSYDFYTSMKKKEMRQREQEYFSANKVNKYKVPTSPRQKSLKSILKNTVKSMRAEYKAAFPTKKRVPASWFPYESPMTMPHVKKTHISTTQKNNTYTKRMFPGGYTTFEYHSYTNDLGNKTRSKGSFTVGKSGRIVIGYDKKGRPIYR